MPSVNDWLEILNSLGVFPLMLVAALSSPLAAMLYHADMEIEMR